ncbi:hypothetical protein B1M_17195, partial [Burkholderia sp. TJI49]
MDGYRRVRRGLNGATGALGAEGETTRRRPHRLVEARGSVHRRADPAFDGILPP